MNQTKANLERLSEIIKALKESTESLNKTIELFQRCTTLKKQLLDNTAVESVEKCIDTE